MHVAGGICAPLQVLKTREDTAGGLGLKRKGFFYSPNRCSRFKRIQDHEHHRLPLDCLDGTRLKIRAFQITAN